MKKYSNVIVKAGNGLEYQHTVLTDVVCDSCGVSCISSDEPDVPLDFEYMDLKANWGYFSEHDLESWTAQVCEKCVTSKLVEIINFRVRGQ